MKFFHNYFTLNTFSTFLFYSIQIGARFHQAKRTTTMATILIRKVASLIKRGKDLELKKDELNIRISPLG